MRACILFISNHNQIKFLMHYCENGRSIIYLRKNYPNGQNCGIQLKESMLSLYLIKTVLLTLSLRKRAVRRNTAIDRDSAPKMYTLYVDSLWRLKFHFTFEAWITPPWKKRDCPLKQYNYNFFVNRFVIIPFMPASL